MVRYNNPSRRNRNIGTEKQGYGKNNRLTIPEGINWRYDWKLYWEKLNDYVIMPVAIDGLELKMVVEKPLDGFYYFVTPWDVIRLLQYIEKEYWSDIDLFVWRQPIKKEIILNNSWGRIAYYTTIEKDVLEGTAIFLNALNANKSFRWDKRISPEAKKELERYKEAGFQCRLTKRSYEFVSSPESNRNLQLLHTIPHELGHYNDYSKHAKFFLSDDPEFDHSTEEGERRISEGTPHYDLKPAHEKEVYAHQFSDNIRNNLKQKGLIPFPWQFDADSADNYSIEKSWFCPSP